MNFNPTELECWITGKPQEQREQNRVAVKQLDLSGNLIQYYPSVRSAHKDTKIAESTISHALNTGKVSKGFKWEYA